LTVRQKSFASSSSSAANNLTYTPRAVAPKRAPPNQVTSSFNSRENLLHRSLHLPPPPHRRSLPLLRRRSQSRTPHANLPQIPRHHYRSNRNASRRAHPLKTQPPRHSHLLGKRNHRVGPAPSFHRRTTPRSLSPL